MDNESSVESPDGVFTPVSIQIQMSMEEFVWTKRTAEERNITFLEAVEFNYDAARAREIEQLGKYGILDRE